VNRRARRAARSVEASLGASVLLLVVPVALAAQASPPTEPTGSLMADTGVSKVRSGKAVIRANMPGVKTAPESLKLSLDGFRIEGDPRLVPEALDEVLAPWKGRLLSFPEYEKAIHAVADYLRANGHPGAKVRMSRAVVGRGTVMIAIEGLSTAKPVTAAAEVRPKVEVKGFRFSGVTLASEEELQALVADLSGKPLTAAEMEQAAQRVANHLRARGYPLVQAYLPPQRVDGGVVEIAVQEGPVDAASGRGGVTVSGGGERVKPGVIEAFLARGAKPGEPLRTADLERAVMLASDLPGVKDVKAQIEPGSSPGSTQVKVAVEETRLFSGAVWGDNYGSRYTGENRLLGQLLLNSPSGYGEQLSLNLVKSSGLGSVRLGAQLPVGSNGWRVGGSWTHMTADFGLNVAILDLNSAADVGNLFVSYPLLRSAQNNVNLIGSYDHKHFITDLTWGRENDRVIGLTSLGATGDLIDTWGGQTRWNLGVGYGNTDLSRHALNQSVDAATAQTQGRFAKLNWQVSRSAAIGESKSWSWQVGASGQYASKNLDTAEKFQLGGPSGVRAYPVGEGLGDNGWLANAEVRYRLGETRLGDAQAVGFYDVGSVSQYAKLWPGALPNRPNDFTLQGFGLGASLGFGERGGAKVMWAKKIGSNPNPTIGNTDADGQNRGARIWIIGNINF